MKEKLNKQTQKLSKLRSDAKTLSEIAHTYKDKYENLKIQKEREEGNTFHHLYFNMQIIIIYISKKSH